MFVIVFGQLTLVLFLPEANTYGSISSFVVALTLRLLCGDKNMGIPPVISFGTIYGEPGSCPEAENEDRACEGAVPFRVIVTVIGIVSNSAEKLLQNITPLFSSRSSTWSSAMELTFSLPRNCRHLMLTLTTSSDVSNTTRRQARWSRPGPGT